MADTVAPQTPSRKLFKPSRKTKTPTPVKRRKSSASTPSLAPDSAFKSTPDASQLSQSPVLQSAESLRSPGPEDLAKSTNLAPLASTPVAASTELADYLGGDKTGNTSTGLVDKDVPTPTDSGRRSTDTTGSFSGNASRTLRRRLSSFKEKLTRTKSNSKPSTPAEPVGAVAGGLADDSLDAKSALQLPINTAESASGKPQDLRGSSASDLPTPANPTDAAKSGADIATYFTEHGNPEMSDFVKALVNTATEDSTARIENGATQKTPSTNEGARNSDQATSALRSQDESADIAFAGQELNFPAPDQVSKMAEGSTMNSENAGPGIAPKNTVGEPDTSNISKEAQVCILDEQNATGNAKDAKLENTPSFPHISKPSEKVEGALTDVGQNTTKRNEVAPDGTRYIDNMGEPARIERSFEIPLPRPERVDNSPPQPGEPEGGRISNSLGDVKDLPSTDDLPSPDDLPEIPEDMPEDPPEEVLDPSVHSTPANITPIPKIPKIPSITSPPPPNLSELARGLSGHTVDDVGNVVDESGKVLGHVTGDLPAMIGKKVSSDGEVYGDSGEIIGYVSENFVLPPPPSEIPADVLGGLKVDHEGNILDSNGNAIGRFHQKPGQNGSLPPFMKPAGIQGSNAENKPKQEEKPRVNAHTGGSPSDIFLDVKSTTDGIQLTIRIPTTFGRQPPDE